MEHVDGVDLSTFQPARARQYGSSGVPASLETVAKQFPIKEAALVKNSDEGVKALLQDYSIAICSNVGFANPNGTPGTRDKNGFCKARGTWGHCMSVIGYRKAVTGVQAGVFILNSWGNDAHGGPVYPLDAPVAGFWCDLPTFDRILKQNDSYAISATTGFPARKLGPLDWYSKVAEPKRHRLDTQLDVVDFLARRRFDPATDYSLAH